MSACTLDVRLSPQSGPGGAPVALKVRASDASAVSAVRVAVVGFGFEEDLARQGGEWVVEATVPYEANPGEYLLDVFALDAAGQRLATARASFQVTP